MKDLGFPDPEAATREFAKNFRVTAEDAAETILRGVERNARRVLIGTDAHILDAMQRLLPSAYQRIVVAGTRRTSRVVAAKAKAFAAKAKAGARKRKPPGRQGRQVRDFGNFDHSWPWRPWRPGGQTSFGSAYAAAGRSNAVRWSVRCIAWSASYSALVVGPYVKCGAHGPS